MCDPMSIATAALSVGQAVMTHIGTNQAYQATVQAANLQYAHEHDIIGQKAVQLDQEKSEAAADTAITTAQAQGAIAASAADQGLGSATISSQLHSAMFGIGRQASIADINDTNARAQLANELQGADITRSSTIAKAPRSSLLELGLGVGKGVMSGVQMHNSIKNAGRMRP